MILWLNAKTYIIVPDDIVAQCQNLYAKKDGNDKQRLRELLALYKGAGYYDNLHEVFLPAFQSYSEEDQLSEVILTPDGKLNIIILGNGAESYMVQELMHAIPFKRYKSALFESIKQRIVTYTPDEKNSRQHLLYIHEYFKWVLKNDNEMATEIILFAISQWKNKPGNALFLVNKLPDLVDRDPGGEIASLMKTLLSKQREDTSVLRFAYYTMNRWGDKAGISLLLENIDGPYGKRDITNLLMGTTYVPFVYRSSGGGSASLGDVSQQFKKWWEEKSSCIHWDEASSSWTAYQSDFIIPVNAKAVKWNESENTYFYTLNKWWFLKWNWQRYYDENKEGCL